MAEAVARREVHRRGWDHVEVASAGVAAAAGAPASGGALRAGQSRGLDLSGHRSSPLTAEAVADADIILTMSAGHARVAEELGGEGRTHLLSAFAHGDAYPDADIPDPFGGDDRVYAETLEAIEELVIASLGRLEAILAP
jgi:protein-tyrosine-phosphatase